MRLFNKMQWFNQWFISKEAVGNVAENDQWGQLFVIFSAILLPTLLYSIKLRTTIDEKGIPYQFVPLQFSKKVISWNDIEHCEVRTYNSLMEYVGWGLHITDRNGRAYNIKGNKGIQILLKSGKKILIGTQKEREAQEIITRYSKEKIKP